jgi:hypothetical protein
MSRDPQLVDRLKQLAGPVDRRGVWGSLEARAAAERSRANRARRRRPRLALAGLAALVLLAGIGVGVYEGVQHWGGDSTLVFTDSTESGTSPGATAPDAAADGWTRLQLAYDAASISSLVMDPSDSAVLYAGTNDGVVFKSTDGAASWKQVLDLHGGIDSIGIDPNEPRILYVLGATRWGYVHVLMRTEDGGATWSDLSASVGLGQVDVNGYSSTEPVFDTRETPSSVLIDAEGWWKSSDGGDHWSNADDADVTDAYAHQSVRDPVSAPRWIVDEASGQKGLVTGYGALSDSADPGILYVATMLGVFKSTDGGATWKNASKGMTSNEVASLVIDPSDPTRMYAATPAGIFRSVDKGASWKSILGGGADADDSGGWDSSGSIVVAPSQLGRLYARTSFGLFRSDNGGDDWFELAGTGLPEDDMPVGVNDPVALVAGDDADVVFVWASDGIYRSADAGATFKRVISGAAKLVPDPRDASTVWSATYQEGVVRSSTDRGATWGAWIDFDLTEPLVDLAVDYREPRSFYVILWNSTGNTIGPFGIPHSVDWETRMNWTGTAGSVTHLLFDPTSPDTVYATVVDRRGEAGTIGIMQSTDAGATWHDISGGLTDAGEAALVVDSTGTVYAATSRGLFRREP